MSAFQINKSDAAKRQINFAVRQLFAKEDPIAIHTVAAAGFKILKDLADKKASCDMHEALKAILKQGMEKEFWAAFNKPANFLKHADIDPDEIYADFKETYNDFIIFMACAYYQELGNELTYEMELFWKWMIAMRPEVIKDDEPVKALMLTPQMAQLRQQPRSEQLEFGQFLLANWRNKDT